MNSTIIYDEDCRLCNGAVRFLKMRKGLTEMDFYPSAGQDSEEILHKYHIPATLTGKTVILIAAGKIYIKSTAIIKALQNKGGMWKVIGIFLLVPVFIRDAIYDIVARYRGRATL